MRILRGIESIKEMIAAMRVTAKMITAVSGIVLFAFRQRKVETAIGFLTFLCVNLGFRGSLLTEELSDGVWGDRSTYLYVNEITRVDSARKARFQQDDARSTRS